MIQTMDDQGHLYTPTHCAHCGSELGSHLHCCLTGGLCCSHQCAVDRDEASGKAYCSNPSCRAKLGSATWEAPAPDSSAVGKNVHYCSRKCMLAAEPMSDAVAMYTDGPVPPGVIPILDEGKDPRHDLMSRHWAETAEVRIVLEGHNGSAGRCPGDGASHWMLTVYFGRNDGKRLGRWHSNNYRLLCKFARAISKAPWRYGP
jgi:hypothetical protein